MTARELAYIYATLKYEWKALEEVRKFTPENKLANLLDIEIDNRRKLLAQLNRQLSEIKLPEINLTEGE